MSSQLRKIISNKVVAAFERCSFSSGNIDAVDLAQKIQATECWTKYNYSLQWRHLEDYSNLQLNRNLKDREYEDILINVAENINRDHSVENAGPLFDKYGSPCLGITVNIKKLWEIIIDPILKKPDSFWKHNDMFLKTSKNVLVCFQSPRLCAVKNISSTRSIILANYIRNINNAVGHNVTTACSVPDHGLEYGIFKYQYDAKQFDKVRLKESSISDVIAMYMKASNNNKLKDHITSIAHESLLQLEAKEKNQIEVWNEFRNILINDVKLSHKKFKSEFDQYTYTSSYTSKYLKDILNILKEKDIVKTTKTGKLTCNDRYGESHVLVRADGLSNPLVELLGFVTKNIDNKYDQYYYICPKSQQKDFELVVSMAEEINPGLSEKVKLITYGEIRKGDLKLGNENCSFQSYVQEVEDLLEKKLTDTGRYYRNTPVSCSMDNIPQVVQSILVIADLKQRRNADYKFNFNDFSMVKLDTGSSLQDFHSKLYKFLDHKEELSINDVDFSVLQSSPPFLELLLHLARFDEVLQNCYTDLESSLLVDYVFKLKSLATLVIGKSFKGNSLSGIEYEVLLTATKNVLSASLRILGVEPINML